MYFNDYILDSGQVVGHLGWRDGLSNVFFSVFIMSPGSFDKKFEYVSRRRFFLYDSPQFLDVYISKYLILIKKMYHLILYNFF